MEGRVGKRKGKEWREKKDKRKNDGIRESRKRKGKEW